jgi:DNA polymerase III epsilon subunit family exonuclease
MGRRNITGRTVIGVFAALIGLAIALAWSLLRFFPFLKNKPASDISFLPPRFVIYDLETTGLDSARHEIIEIGAIRVNRDSDVHDTFKAFVIPSGRISGRTTELTGITREMVMNDGQSLSEAMASFREFVGDLPLIAYNADFDRAFLRASCRRTGGSPIMNTHWCALTMARQAWPGRQSYKLAELARDGGEPVGQTHRALDDCRLTLKVYIAAALTIGAPKPGRLKSPPSNAPRAVSATSGVSVSSAPPPGFV